MTPSVVQVPVKPDGLPEPHVSSSAISNKSDRFTLPKKLICMNTSGSYKAETHQVKVPHSRYTRFTLYNMYNRCTRSTMYTRSTKYTRFTRYTGFTKYAGYTGYLLKPGRPGLPCILRTPST